MINYMTMLGDLTDGQSKAFIRERFEGNGYGQKKNVSFERAWNKLIQEYARELENSDTERAKLYARYLNIYKMAVDNGRAADARQILDSMAKVAGLADERLTVDAGGSSVTISFGINKEEKDE